MTIKAKRFMVPAVVLLVGGATLASAFGYEQAEEDEQPVAMAQVPAKARAALRDLAKNEKIKEVVRVSRGDAVGYEGAWKSGGHSQEATVTTDGALMETEAGIDADQAPAGVKAAAAKHFKDAKGLVFEKKTVIMYVVGPRSGDESHEIQIMPDGRMGHADDDEAHEQEHGHEREDGHEDED